MFGHRKGAFTGALADHPGYLRSAERGTLFLDEIAELPSNTQAKFLRFLESGECLPVGELRPLMPDVRIIAATHRDLREEVREGRFREDLYFRLNVVPLPLPPLRDRPGDLEELLQHFVTEAGRRFGLPLPDFSAAALESLRAYAWPGNVRELRNLAERMVVLFHGGLVEAGNLPAEIRQGSGLAASPDKGFRLPDRGLVLDELEADMIRQALQRTQGNRSRAARLLGLTRDTLLYRLKKYAIA
jgi:DNA-binding NtrC family response regulator